MTAKEPSKPRADVRKEPVTAWRRRIEERMDFVRATGERLQRHANGKPA